MTSLNGAIAVILRYFTEFDSFAGRLRHSDRPIMSEEYRLLVLAKTDRSCSAVCLRYLSCLLQCLYLLYTQRPAVYNVFRFFRNSSASLSASISHTSVLQCPLSFSEFLLWRYLTLMLSLTEIHLYVNYRPRCTGVMVASCDA